MTHAAGREAGERPEDGLMARYASGEDAVAQRLFELLVPRLRAFFNRSGRGMGADDLVQQTLLKVHLARSQFIAPGPVSPWFFTIARRVQADDYRRTLRLPQFVGDELLEHTPAPQDPAIVEASARAANEALAARVQAAMAALPESQRVVIQLHCFAGLTFARIAVELGTTEGAVRVRATRAYAKLRESLTGLGPEGRNREDEP